MSVGGFISLQKILAPFWEGGKPQLTPVPSKPSSVLWTLCPISENMGSADGASSVPSSLQSANICGTITKHQAWNPNV